MQRKSVPQEPHGRFRAVQEQEREVCLRIEADASNCQVCHGTNVSAIGRSVLVGTAAPGDPVYTER